MKTLFLLFAVIALVQSQATGSDTWFSPMGVVPLIDGTNNNLLDSTKGAIGKLLQRGKMAIGYPDGKGSFVPGTDIRTISLTVFSVDRPDGGFNPQGYSDMLTFWGQMIDHDIDLTNTNGSDPTPLPMPQGDPFFDPLGTGTVTMAFVRSVFQLDSNGVRQQPNAITAYLYLSVVYGSDNARRDALKTATGGFMNTTILAGIDGGFEMPPRNEKGFAMNNAAQKVSNAALWFFGDVRGNENSGVIMYHTLMIREHNRLVRGFQTLYPGLNDTQYYELGRKWVRAEFQCITETQYFPLIVGPGVVPPYTGYNENTDASIQIAFSGAAFRYGHSEGNEVFYRLDESRNVIPQGNALMENVFFDNRWSELGISPILRGMAIQRQQAVDAKIIAPLRNFLYGQPGAGGTDLVCRNIGRGRDHGIPDFNQVRIAYGLPAYTSFAQIHPDPAIQNVLIQAYGANGINNIDLYAGGLAEATVPGSNLGPTFQAIIRDQYVRMRDGDRFWWNQPGIMFTQDELTQIRAMTLSKMVLLNSDIVTYPCNPFIASGVNNCDKNGIIQNPSPASALVAAPLLVIFLIFALLF